MKDNNATQVDIDNNRIMDLDTSGVNLNGIPHSQANTEQRQDDERRIDNHDNNTT